MYSFSCAVKVSQTGTGAGLINGRFTHPFKAPLSGFEGLAYIDTTLPSPAGLGSAETSNSGGLAFGIS
ncbi:MAG: hypothetical protein BWY84_01137 [Candidatus Aerophobetes bacterium ADurb.Bin490]|nr:MAG: hypothetical protein BWY84_01137 [Candidatus Aerophobetes bacterium ADurb.Bin490]